MGCCAEDNFDPGADGSSQVFRYVAAGGEANPLTINLPGARPDTNYNVQVTLARPAANALKDLSIVSTSLTLTTFDVELSAPLEADDILMFTVEELIP